MSIPTPVPNMPATLCFVNDRKPYTVLEVHSNRRISVRRCKAKRTDKNGLSENQTYTFSEDPTREIEVFTLRKNGRWIAEGTDTQHAGCWLRLGEREEYSNPSG